MESATKAVWGHRSPRRRRLRSFSGQPHGILGRFWPGEWTRHASEVLRWEFDEVLGKLVSLGSSVADCHGFSGDSWGKRWSNVNLITYLWWLWQLQHHGFVLNKTFPELFKCCSLNPATKLILIFKKIVLFNYFNLKKAF